MKKIFLLFATIPCLAACYGTTDVTQVQYVVAPRATPQTFDMQKNAEIVYIDKKSVAKIPHFTKRKLSRISSADFINQVKDANAENQFIIETATVQYTDIGPDWAFMNLDVNNDTFMVSAFFIEPQFVEFETFKKGDTITNLLCTYQKSRNFNYVSGAKCHLLRYE